MEQLRGQAQAVDAACCEDSADCAGGVPRACGAECAVAFLPFFDSCQELIESTMGRESMQQMDGLADRCLSSRNRARLFSMVRDLQDRCALPPRSPGFPPG